MSMITKIEEAQRLARAIASDLALYNEDKVRDGIVNDSFFDIMAKEIEEGRQHYNSRVDPGLLSTHNFFDRALVDVILKRKGHIKSKIW